MAISIKEINVRNLGPLKELTLHLRRLNLIYGQNEKGKTYLVEFVIRSLFKHSRQWQLRPEEGRGRVRVAGLSTGDLVDFSPKSKTKLEDYWDETNPGLPPDFSKLLVVKGAEVQIANTDGGVDKTILKRFLSNREVLDRVESRISKTLQESRIENQVIVGPKRGELHAKSELESQLRTLNRLFEQINRGYSRGRYKMLLDRREELETETHQMVKAKQHSAHCIDVDLQRLRRQLLSMTRTDVQEVRSRLVLFRQKEFEFNRKQEQQRNSALNSKDYLWLKNAHSVYQNMLSRHPDQPKPYLVAGALVFLVCSAGLTLLSLTYWAVGALAGAATMAYLYLRQYQITLKTAGDQQEIKKLNEEFLAKFNQKLKGLPQILEMLERMEEDYNTTELLNKQIAEDLNQLHGLKLSVSDGIFSLLGERKDPKTWDDALSMVEAQTKRLESRIREKELSLAKLGVDPSDFYSTHPGVEFSNAKLENLTLQTQSVEEDIQQELQKLASLKQLICQQTHDDISTKWETVIEHLRERREELSKNYQQKVAEILGKIAVKEVIAELRKDEDSKVANSLESKEVQTLVEQVTNRYNRIQLKGERLLVSDPFHDFYLSDLSTGAQEQILLALRIGFSTKLMLQDTIFLILDDAFQYSDWHRRPLLIDKVVALAERGWQIIYFTMDNHIRDLFSQKGQRLGSEFKMIELD